MIDYDAELQLHNERLRAAYGIKATDRVLDIGCGTGQTTREAAGLASNGEALGIDIDEAAIARARELADLEGLQNARFEAGDVQVHPFQPSAFDVAISRFGTMFFADTHAAFRNIARAIRADGRLVMMVWQTHDQNEWSASIDHALGQRQGSSGADDDADPFSLGEPTTVRRILGATGFKAITLANVDVPVYYGRDVDTALDFVGRFAVVSRVLGRSDRRTQASILAALRVALAAHESERGIWFDSRSWIVTARRR